MAKPSLLVEAAAAEQERLQRQEQRASACANDLICACRDAQTMTGSDAEAGLLLLASLVHPSDMFGQPCWWRQQPLNNRDCRGRSSVLPHAQMI